MNIVCAIIGHDLYAGVCGRCYRTITKGEDMNLTANTLKIDTDEGRFVLIVDTDEIGRMSIDIHALALEFESEVRRELRPYALEAEHARMTMPPSYDPSEAYALDDPKSPGYYERMVD